MKPDPKLIDSMALRYRHDFGFLDEQTQNSIRTTMKQLWEEVVGEGFYKLPQQEISDEHTTLISAIRQGTGMSINDAKIALLDITEDIVELCRQWYRKNGKKF
jgi:hypothetical protein